MTNAEIKTFNNDNIRSQTQPLSIKKTKVADAVDNLVDYVDQETAKGYLELSFWLTISSGTPTVEEIVNDFTGVTFSYSVPTAGRIQIDATSGVFTANKVNLQNGSIGTASGGFFTRWVQATTSFGLIYFTRWDNDTTTNATFNRVRFEIRVYP